MSELASYAATETNSRGRVYKEEAPAHRNQFQRDRDRIIHCAAFRRLEYKTQVFVNHEGDMFRTRLTHSIEVAQIGRTIARALHLNEDLTEAICLAHDLGHTPFGHAGQDALNICMQDYGGFEHNMQSLRVVDLLEEKYAEYPGLNLMFETREGILKHCSRKNAMNLGELGERFLQGYQPGLEAQIANMADEIAYNNHDTDDGLRSGLITVEQLESCEIFSSHMNAVNRQWIDLSEKKRVHETIRRMINDLVSDLIENTRANIESLNPQTIEDVRHVGKPLIQQGDVLKSQHQALKQFLRNHLYKHERVVRMTEQARETVTFLFEAYLADYSHLPDEARMKAENGEGPNDPARCIADYIAGMTDRFALAEKERLKTG